MSEPNDKKQGQTFIEKKPKKDSSYYLNKVASLKGIVLIIASLLFMSAAFYGFFELRSYFSQGDSLSCAENPAFISGAADAIKNNNRNDLSLFVEEASDFKNNRDDQNCVYIFVNQYVLDGDINKARDEYGLYISMYEEEKDKFAALGVKPKSNEQLEIAVNNLVQFQSDALENARNRGQYVGE